MTGERLERLCFVTASDVCGQEIILYCERTGRRGALLARVPAAAANGGVAEQAVAWSGERG